MRRAQDVFGVLKGLGIVGKTFITSVTSDYLKKLQPSSATSCLRQAGEAMLASVSSLSLNPSSIKSFGNKWIEKTDTFLYGAQVGLPAVFGEKRFAEPPKLSVQMDLPNPSHLNPEYAHSKTEDSNVEQSGVETKHNSAYNNGVVGASQVIEVPLPRAAESVRPSAIASDRMTSTSVNLDVESRLVATSKERKVPASRVGRFLRFGSLAVQMGLGALAEMTKRSLNLSEDTNAQIGNPFLTSANMERLVSTLCRVRGAALKLGQMLSIQDSTMFSPQIQEVFERVRFSADFMPVSQVKKTLIEEYGDDWREHFQRFDEKPFAAASIGQVHFAILQTDEPVAMKIQYPGVSKSIQSDIDNLLAMLNVFNFLPRGMFLDSFAKSMRKEIALECDFVNEANAMLKFRELLADDSDFYVPMVHRSLVTAKILPLEFARGCHLDKCVTLEKSVRDWIAKKMLELCLRELFEFRFMQTDPNWSNFLYDDAERPRIVLLDFGASRNFDDRFVDQYFKVIKASVDCDRDAIVQYSRDIGFLTGYESKVMENAHTDAVMILGEAFGADGGFDFGAQSTTKRINQLVPVMLEHRLRPPPEEIYSLHRKMAGAFLLCAKLRATVDCRTLFQQVTARMKPS